MKIFVASTGRCGTKFLSEIFKYYTDIPAFHEPIPYVISEALEDLNQNNAPSERSRKVLSAKVAQVNKDSKDGMYMESNQQFIKAYVKTMLETFDDVYCIYLYRNPFDMLLSFAEKCRHFETDWFLQPHWESNFNKDVPGMSFYEIVLWQWFEVRRRYYFWKDKFKGSFEFDFCNLNNKNELNRMFKHFGIKNKPITDLSRYDKNPTVALKIRTENKMINNLRANWSRIGQNRFAWDLRELALQEKGISLKKESS
jgi:hypothetical protein